jgi:hypothetical protein
MRLVTRILMVGLAGPLVAAVAACGAQHSAAPLHPSAPTATAPGGLNCPLAVYNPTHWALKAGDSVTCTIEGATDVSGSSVDVIVKSSTLGNATVTGSVSGTTITFDWQAPAGACETSIVAYKTNGNNSNNSFITPGGSSAAGFGYVDANGNPAACDPPSAVTFRSLTAVRTARGVVLRWTTASELGTVGYVIFRESAGKRVRLNSSLVKVGSGVLPNRYSWLDQIHKSGSYWVEAVERKGAPVWRGPVSAG